MNERQTNLDMVRGLAALWIVVSHTGAFFFKLTPDISGVFSPERALSFIIQYNYSAVMVFFVLSGFLVGGTVIRKVSDKKWSWIQYGCQRLTRLWVVLLPALILTLVLDHIGHSIGDRRSYNGAHDDFSCFLGNLFFLQNVQTHVYGSNGPLWSLANEFWYYTLFPLIYLSVMFQTRLWIRIAGILSAAGIALLLPRPMMSGGLVWLMGVGAFACIRHERIFQAVRSLPFFLLSILLFSLSFHHPPMGQSDGGDYFNGLAFSGMLPFLASRTWNSTGFKKISKMLSEISYTLYCVHFPILFFLFNGLKLPGQQLPSIATCGLYLSVILSILVFASGWWFLFERQTPKVRSFCEKILVPFLADVIEKGLLRKRAKI